MSCKLSRDKIITIRVNANLLNKFNNIVKEKKLTIDGYNNISTEYWYKNLTIADVVEITLLDFIEKYQ